MVMANNPIQAGFYPDPSICRVGNDFYMVHSSFCYFPGVPIFHSTDLANWEQIGHVLDRSSQLVLDGCRHSQGIFAPTIRYHDGVFYMITTNVSGGGNFIVTSKHPSKDWSEPYYLGEKAKGIDPSLFFDEDGRCYYIGTRGKEQNGEYDGDNEIWIQELDLTKMKLIGESTAIWTGAMKRAVWAEGPHLYKKGEYYYLMIAEGGTAENHSITIARSKQIQGPYEGNRNNPIFTHRHLGGKYPVVYVGHGDMAEDTMGNWYMVMLASRPYEGYTNMGRETFLAKVVWEDDWPVVNPGIGKLEDKVSLPFEKMDFIPEEPCIHFLEDKLQDCFVMLRNPKKGMYQLGERTGFLRLFLQPETIKEQVSPAYIAIRQKHSHYQVSTLLDFSGKLSTEVAGLVILQSNYYHIRMEQYYEGNNAYIQLIKCENGIDTKIVQKQVPIGNIILKIVNRGQKANFYCMSKGKYIEIAKQIDVHMLSTEIAGGFTGCTIGMYASSNGKESDNYADFGWMSYSAVVE